MNAENYAMRLVMDGFVAIPDVFTQTEVEALRDAFEARAEKIGKRWMAWEDLYDMPAYLNYIAHPNLMAVVNAFGAHFGEDMVFCNASGARDVCPDSIDHDAPTPDIRGPELGWHDDVMGVKVPYRPSMELGMNCLLYLDETFADNGAYCTAIGSHHLAYYDENDQPVMTSKDVVLDSCELRPCPVKPGTVLVHRSHSWHGVMPAKQRRRVVLQTFGSASAYHGQNGHTQLDKATLAKIPEERHRYFRWYETASVA